jgi:signal transduction histidine kinase
MSQVSETDVWESVIFIAFGSLAILLVVYFTYRWVLRPVGGISESLATGNLVPLEPYYDERSELGRVAGLVRSSFQDRAKLRGTMEERAQLSRDLHDGLIQALYAIGMNLASIGPLLRRKPEQAETQLDLARTELNASIRELRSFITRLEPADAEKKDFGKAVRQLVEFMQTAHPTTFKLDIDEALAAGLAVERSTQLLYIVREALSNALRHGRGDTVTLRLQPAEDHAVLSIHDNGRGFDPAAPRQGGHGLDYMTERALQVAGTLQVSSVPGQGTLVTVRFPHPL